MAQIPIRSLTLYKQGIGYFQRRGATDDTSVTLVVPRDSLNDVLKSLAIVVHAGGPIQSVDYETPADKTQLLDDLPVKIADRAGLTDLLISLRGSAELIIQEREARTSYENIATWQAEYIEELREAGGLDELAYSRLQGLLSIAQEQTADDARSSAIEAELAQLLDLQEQLRKNLGALGDSEREVSLRNRLLDDLEASEERRRAIAATRREIEQQRQAREARQHALIDEIYNGAGERK